MGFYFRMMFFHEGWNLILTWSWTKNDHKFRLTLIPTRSCRPPPGLNPVPRKSRGWDSAEHFQEMVEHCPARNAYQRLGFGPCLGTHARGVSGSGDNDFQCLGHGSILDEKVRIIQSEESFHYLA